MGESVRSSGAEVQRLIAEATERSRARAPRGYDEDLFLALAQALEGYLRALSAHHELSTLSDEVIREYDFRECPVCARARKRDEGDGVAEAAPHH